MYAVWLQQAYNATAVIRKMRMLAMQPSTTSVEESTDTAGAEAKA